ncbi:MAG: hypothetical protein P3X22_001850 [Thermoprotei archaeon]|nr:hypothetical protein [Thermoprotei archaeon]
MRVTDYTSNPLFGIWGFIGDYFNVVATKDNVHIVWTDTRRGLARIGGFTWRGVDQSIFTAKIGPRPQPQIDIEPPTLEAGQAWVITIRGSNLPREAPLLLGFEGAGVGVLAFTDSEGRVEAKLLTPASREGVVKVSLHDFSTLSIVAEGSVSVVNTMKTIIGNSTTVINIAIEKLGLQVNESIKTLSDNLASFRSEALGKVEVVNSAVNEINKGLLDLRGNFEAKIKTIEDKLGGVQTTLNTVKTSVDTVKGDVEAARGSLEEAIGEAKDAITTSSRNWGSINAFLIIVALVLLGYHVYTSRRF